MSANPRLGPMTRTLLGIVLALTMAACSSGAGSADDERSEPDAEAAKVEMDAAAADVLPDLAAALGGSMSGLQARFFERGGFGIWDYVADGKVGEPPGTMAAVLDTTEGVLSKQGYTVTRDESEKRVTGKKGSVSLIVEAGLLSDVRTVSSLDVHLAVSGISDGDDFAKAAPAEDYLAYVE